MKEVKKIVIVGGGSAGWITASWFSRRWGAKMDVTIIDKYKPERVGVGEATLLSFPGVMEMMVVTLLSFQENQSRVTVGY